MPCEEWNRLFKEYEAASREGIWWLPNETATDYLVLTNQGSKAMSVTLSASDATGKESKQSVMLGPRATSRYSLRSLVESGSLAGTYGGIRIYAPAHAGSLDTVHFLFDQKAGFSALLKMFDHDPNATIQQSDYAQTSIWTLRAPMLALTQPDPSLAFPVGTTLHPQIFVRNTTSKPLAAALRFSWRAENATGRALGPSLQLLPYETRQIDVAALQDGKILPANAHWTSVTMTTNSQPDEVMAVAVSYDSTLRYGAQTPFSDQLSFKWEGGEWQYDAEHNSIMTAGNGGTKPALAAFTLYYDHGTQRYDLEQMLQPDEQMWMDVGKLIREHVPDKDGKTLPADLTSGSYEFSDLTDPIIGTLFEGKITYERTYGHVTYGCSTQCCGDDSPWLKVDPLNVAAGSTATNGVLANTCNGYFADVSPKFYGGWTTDDPSVATVDEFGKFTGVGAGSTTAFADGLLPQEAPRKCPLVDNVASGTIDVAPVITNISPARGPVTMTVFGISITGSGFGTSPTVNAGSGITVDLISATDTLVQLNFIIAGTATPGNHGVTVSANGKTSNSVNFFVQYPTSIAVLNTVSQGAGSCQTGRAGWVRVVTLQLLDQSTQPIQFSGFTMADQLSAGSPNTCLLNSFNTGVGNTDANGSWTDTYSICSTVCVTTNCQTNATQTWTANGLTVTQPVQVIYKCDSITVNGS